ncbi:MAG: coproporphyrinogen dehydrogenase, partial [Alphaproteobacteria bacterium]
VSNDRPVRGYVETLKAEIALISARLPEGVRLSRLHWGGGTPTILPPDAIADLAGAITERIPFAEGAEFSVEIDPMEVDEARVAALAAAGMNRASIGIQDFDPLIQEAIGRPQPFERTREVVAMLREAGVTSLNADMVYGLPHQSLARITRTTEQLLELAPDRVALFGYAHVPWMSRRQVMIPEAALPAPEERLALFRRAAGLLEGAGMVPIGIDHFARPGDGLARALAERRLHRNFQGYTDDAAPTLIGVGASAIGRFRQGYVQNAPATAAYQARIRDGGLATVRGHAFSDEDLRRARIIEELMCYFEADVAAAAEGAEAPLAEALRADAERAAERFAEHVRWDGARLAITARRRPLARLVARVFDAYTGTGARHSAAI